VQNLVPHLPGLDKDKIYVISGPFPNFDPMSGPSQLLMATPVSPGATVIAVPMGCPPPHVKQVGGAPQHGLPGPAFHPVQPQHGLPGPAFHPVQPHMLHWDCQHPAGQIVPLRQPSGPVYYNVPASHTSSGLQSPNSEGSGSLSESSSTSGDQEGEALGCLHPMGKYQPIPSMMGLPARHVQGCLPPAYHQLGPVFMPPHHLGPGHFPLYDQVYISP